MVGNTGGGGGGGVAGGGGGFNGGGSGGNGDDTYGGGGGGGGAAFFNDAGDGGDAAGAGGTGGSAGSSFGAVGGDGAIGIGGGGGAAGAGGGGGAGYGGGGGAGGSGGGGGGSSFVVPTATDVDSWTNAADDETDGDGFVLLVYDPVADACARPTFTKAFAPDTIAPGNTSTLTYTIDGSATTVAATSVAFTDVLPSGVEIASSPNASTSCTGGTLTAAAGTNTIALADGTLAAAASCTVSVDVTPTTAGTHASTSGDLTSSLGNSGTASALLTASMTTTDVTPATGAGTITVAVDGASGCSIATATGLTVEDAAGSGPDRVALPHGLIDLSLTSCSPGGAVTITVTYPAPLAADATFWKYGPTVGDPTPHWYELTSAVIAGATVTYTITDGGEGDDDLTANGTIEDPAGAGVPATAVPALPAVVMSVLTLLLVAIGGLGLRRRAV
jgi:hypothetical protein